MPVAMPDTVRLALKTNLLFYAAGGLNVGVEVPVGRKFSASLTGVHTWLRWGKERALQTIQGGVDVKYWFDQLPERHLTGWNAGLYAVWGGPWDVQWNRGWQGNSFFSTGVVGGYSRPVSRRMNIELSVAAGLFHTPEARQYDRSRGGGILMWHQTRRNVSRFSITKAQINLVWLIEMRMKKK